MTIILHAYPNSTCSMRVLVCLEELNITDYKLEFVDLFKWVHKGPEFLKLQPFGVVPVIQDGDLTLFESRAICGYLCQKFGGSALMGKTLKEKAVISQWLEVEVQNYNPHVSKICYHRVVAPMLGMPCDESVVTEQTAKLEKVLDVYEAHLSKSKYLAGDVFSLADLAHLPYTNMLVNAAGKGDLITSRPHVSAWWTSISERPSWKKVQIMAKTHGNGNQISNGNSN